MKTGVAAWGLIVLTEIEVVKYDGGMNNKEIIAALNKRMLEKWNISKKMEKAHSVSLVIQLPKPKMTMVIKRGSIGYEISFYCSCP